MCICICIYIYHIKIFPYFRKFDYDAPSYNVTTTDIGSQFVPQVF